MSEIKTAWIKYGLVGASAIVSVIILSCTVYAIKARDVISVTGLGEETFVSDKIVWTGRYQTETTNRLEGYKEMERCQKIVADYLAQSGIDAKEITFSFISADKNMEPIYNSLGNYSGSRFVGYRLEQSFTIVSNEVDRVETVSREISSVIAKGVNIMSNSPEYYYTKLDDLKLTLIEKASKDARARALKVVENAGAKLGKASSASLGVFQITSATGNEDYLYGGTFNTWSKEKKASVTVRMSYKLK